MSRLTRGEVENLAQLCGAALRSGRVADCGPEHIKASITLEKLRAITPVERVALGEYFGWPDPPRRPQNSHQSTPGRVTLTIRGAA